MFIFLSDHFEVFPIRSSLDPSEKALGIERKQLGVADCDCYVHQQMYS